MISCAVAVRLAAALDRRIAPATLPASSKHATTIESPGSSGRSRARSMGAWSGGGTSEPVIPAMLRGALLSPVASGLASDCDRPPQRVGIRLAAVQPPPIRRARAFLTPNGRQGAVRWCGIVGYVG